MKRVSGFGRLTGESEVRNLNTKISRKIRARKNMKRVTVQPRQGMLMLKCMLVIAPVPNLGLKYTHQNAQYKKGNVMVVAGQQLHLRNTCSDSSRCTWQIFQLSQKHVYVQHDWAYVQISP